MKTTTVSVAAPRGRLASHWLAAWIRVRYPAFNSYQSIREISKKRRRIAADENSVVYGRPPRGRV